MVRPCTIISFLIFLLLCGACLGILYESLDYIWYYGTNSDGTYGVTPFYQCTWVTVAYVSYWQCYGSTSYSSVYYGRNSGRLIYACMAITCIIALLSFFKMIRKINSTDRRKKSVDSSIFSLLALETILMIASIGNECAVISSFKSKYSLYGTTYGVGFFLAVSAVVIIVLQVIVYTVLKKVQEKDDVYQSLPVVQGQVVAQPGQVGYAQPIGQAQPIYAQPAPGYNTGAPAPQGYGATPQYPYSQQGGAATL